MPSIYNGGQTPMEAAAIIARNILIAQNTYDVAVPNNYTAIHTRALADNLTPVQGKGTGNFLDINNYGAGGFFDISGYAIISLGSGRNPNMTLNNVTWGYGPNGLGMINYLHPNTSLNIGQVII